MRLCRLLRPSAPKCPPLQIASTMCLQPGGFNNNNNTQIAAIALPPLTTHPQLWAELLTFKPKCTIA